MFGTVRGNTPMLPYDIPTALTPAERETLMRLALGRRVMEIGSLLGHSTIALAYTAKQVIAIDPHDGYPEDSPRPTLESFVRNITSYGVHRKVVPVVALAQDAIKLFTGANVSMVFIDATGCAKLTWELMVLVFEQINPAILCVHDYGHPKWIGATEAVDRFADTYSRRFSLTDTLATFQLQP